MLISDDINSKKIAGNICTRILQYVHNFFQIDELSMKASKIQTVANFQMNLRLFFEHQTGLTYDCSLVLHILFLA